MKQIDKELTPDYLFEVSWEVCNKVGGIHTVIATKALNMVKELENRHILIGPDVWRETQQNPEFLEDPRLLRSWRDKASREGLRLRVGRWNVAGNPIAVLVDFTSYIAHKDEIFTDLWKRFKLDSISGQWDYIEPALFGYASGKVIESYIRFNLAPHHKAVAQFHEWMTGTGLLYLKSTNLPIATTFTTHATVLGRCIAGNMLPLYDAMESYNPTEKAREYNVIAKQSLEKVSACYADAFTTVSEITARECAHFLDKEVDIVTPNGFENSFTPSEKDFPDKIRQGRQKLLETASLLLKEKVEEDAFIVGIGGRYEFKNKGVDVFIEAMGRLDKQLNGQGREILAFLTIPAGHHGPKKVFDDKYTTHYLNEPQWDPAMNKIREMGLLNGPQNRVKIFFIPCYLNGTDGLINMTYYDLLVGMDLSVFPSYYEPWGYTPLESLAFKVPTVTTTLTGFGMWVEKNYKGDHPGIDIIHRNDVNDAYVVDSIAASVLRLSALSTEEMEKVKANAKDVSTIALWDNHVVYYRQAYSIALAKIIEHLGEFPVYREEVSLPHHSEVPTQPNWSPVTIQKELPSRLIFLDTLSKNLWWSWNQEAIDLFAGIDEGLWIKSEKNPILLLDKISLKKYKELEKNKKFLQQLDLVEERFTAYMKGKETMPGPKIAYFSMEYGLDWSLKIYSGGLGILAGDYLKESSDKQVNITAVGLLYRYGYFRQRLSAQGDQVSEREAIDFQKVPVTPVRDANDNWATISIAFPGRNMYARIWRADVGRTELYLLDTDFEENLPEDRAVTYQLYGGDWENRLKQEILLGVGGIRALRLLGKDADVYHCNEGHAAFTSLERMREYVDEENLQFNEAIEVVRSSSLFTTHTPVPAGHDAFTEDILRPYFGHYPARLKTTWEVLMGLGKANPCNSQEKFSMSFLAANLSQEINGVSMLHGKVSQHILNPLWPGYLPEELSQVSYVTNGVHHPTWTAPEWKELHLKVFGEQFATHHYEKSCFEGILQVSDKEVWDLRNGLRTKMIEHIIAEFSNTSIAPAYYSPKDVVAIRATLRKDILTIGFARRFATYKRAHLLFSNLDRLSSIINNPQRPVQFLFAGKAHPADKAGQDLIKRIIEVSRMPQFIGKILFIPNYNMDIAKELVQGTDVWMNTPTRPLEASGTSGEKASMNGVMHFSVLDGWWVEGYRKGAGWALPEERTYDNQDYQNELDAATIYDVIENEIAPMFYKRNKENVPVAWVQQVKNTIAHVACNFTTNRMMEDYEQKYYHPLAKRFAAMTKDNYQQAREIAYWKKRIEREWGSIEVLSYEHPNDNKDVLALGREQIAHVRLHLGDLQPQDVGVEMVVATRGKNEEMLLDSTIPFELEQCENGEATFCCKIVPQTAGAYYLAARVFAHNSKLIHRQDCPLVKWL